MNPGYLTCFFPASVSYLAWIPAFAGMTSNQTFLRVFSPSWRIRKLLLQISALTVIVCMIPLCTRSLNRDSVRESAAVFMPRAAWKCRRVRYLFGQNDRIRNLDRITGLTKIIYHVHLVIPSKKKKCRSARTYIRY